MELINSALFTLFILALLLISWLLGFYARNKTLPFRKFSHDPDYFLGLNYLLNDEPDDAIDVFIEALEVNSSTLDTHLALGTLLRRRGKVDRSIEHYESLLENKRFSSRQNNEIRIHLSRSYIAAGLLDRAEYLLADLKQSQTSFRTEALKLAVMVYQIEKDWELAIENATELLKLLSASDKRELLMRISHFHCEIAETLLTKHQVEAARGELKKALRLFKTNVRIYILSARVEYLSKNYQDAVNALYKAIQIDPSFFGTVVIELREYMQQAGAEQKLFDLVDLQKDLKADSNFQIEFARHLRNEGGVESALSSLLQDLKDSPSLELLQKAMEMAADSNSHQLQVLKVGADAIEQYLLTCSYYRCESCGFELKKLHWSCPGCNSWGMVIPIEKQIPQTSEMM